METTLKKNRKTNKQKICDEKMNRRVMDNRNNK